MGRWASSEALTIFTEGPLDTIVYVDGFNFYYGAVKDTNYKWLDFNALFQRILPRGCQITAIKYFTARVAGLPNDPSAPNRQDRFIKALEAHIASIEIYYGKFATHDKWFHLTDYKGPQLSASNYLAAKVKETKEKGSDVNLAVHLLNDAWIGNHDCSVVVSNDSDLSEAMRLVKSRGNVQTILLTPRKFRKKRSRVLVQHSDFALTIKEKDLAACQLPDPVYDARTGKSIHKPSAW